MTLRVVQLNCAVDRDDHAPEALLAAWPTLPAVAAATACAGAEVTVVQASRRAAACRRDGVDYIFVAGSGARLLAEAVARAAPDVVHLNGLDFPRHARAVARTGVPVLVQDHASRAGGRLGLLRRWGHGGIAAAAFTALDQASPFVARGEIPARARLFAIQESSSDFTPGDRAAARRATGLHGDPALLWVGHLDANKDPLTILRAAARALDALPGLRLWCAFATAPLIAEIDRLLAAEPVLAARVHLLGRVPHETVEALCRAADLFVLGSHREGSGYALIEALACGLPPVVSDIPSFRALTGDGAVGAVAPAADAEAFAAAIVAIAGRASEAARRATRDHFARMLSFDVVGRQLLAAYEAVARAR